MYKKQKNKSESDRETLSGGFFAVSPNQTRSPLRSSSHVGKSDGENCKSCSCINLGVMHLILDAIRAVFRNKEWSPSRRRSDR